MEILYANVKLLLTIVFLFVILIRSATEGEKEMSVLILKKNGQVDNISIFGDDLLPFCDLLEALWNESNLTADTAEHQKGLTTLFNILKEFRV